MLAPKRPGRHIDLASALRVCPECLGDLVPRSDAAGSYLVCTHCHLRTGVTSPRSFRSFAYLGQPVDALAYRDRFATSRALMN
jgi:hypothetical protein